MKFSATKCSKIVMFSLFSVMTAHSANSMDADNKCLKPKNYEIVKDIKITPFFKFSDRKLQAFVFSLNEMFSYLSGKKFVVSGKGRANLIYLSGSGIIEGMHVSEKASQLLIKSGLTQNISGYNLNTNKCSLQTFYKKDGSHAYSIVFNEKKEKLPTDLDYKCMILSTASMYECEYSNYAESAKDILLDILAGISKAQFKKD